MILVIDYGMGNLRSVSKALEHLGGKVVVSSSPDDIEKADKIVLPGVGAFGDAVKELRDRHLVEPLAAFIRNQKPFLGICLGLQLLFPASDESAGAQGLGIYPGKVRAFQSPKIKIPHMGWNQVSIRPDHPLLQGIAEGSYFYFVHSYYGVPEDEKWVIGRCTYGQEEFAAILGRGPTLATQFHPEKSQAAGLQILKNFIAW